MTLLAETSDVMTKTRELCAAIAGDAHFSKLQQDVERFLGDDGARLMYQTVHQRGEELHHKQHSGVKLAPTEIREFEAARDALMSNEVASAFLDAQDELESLQKTIGKYINMTLELGRVPSEQEVAQAEKGGCCGGGGCGC
ncbi:YlbF family regulator [Luteolibacter flavescens]|uniref:YlbF family regulator n=1 Tax=Luteolibacter flavescens TaxID=1859460 RepID=A0ABT3FJ37_9BACT|nr:YlbF family regulator [Luteolibacter flavescens]MCW1883219.1 YlbF family regulator [Luteolibacter flavescens]